MGHNYERQPKQAQLEPPPAASLSEELLGRVVMMLVSVRSRADVLRALVSVNQPRLTMAEASEAVREATRRISLAASVDFDYELGRALARLDELYAMASLAKDAKTALAVQRDRTRLLGLYPSKDSPGDIPAAETASEALAELAAVRASLAPLVKSNADEPVGEIARRVVALFVSKPAKKPRK